MTNNTIKKIYVKEDKTLNKFTLFLSVLAIVLIVLLMVHFKELKFFNTANAAEISVEDAKTELYQYIDSINGFTDSQRDALNSIIADYVNDKTVVKPEEMNTMYDVIHQNYQTNKEYVESIRNELLNQMNSGSNTDDGRYKEINASIEKIDRWIEQADNDVTVLQKKVSASTDSSNPAIRELARKQEESNTSFTSSIKKLSDDFSEQNKKSEEEASNIKSSITKISDDIATTNEKNEADKQHLISEVKNLSDTVSANAQKNEADKIAFNSLIEDLKKYSDASESKLTGLVNQLSDNFASEQASQKSELERIEKNISDIENRLNFGYSNGCYGYYIDDGQFMPF